MPGSSKDLTIVMKCS